MARTAFKLKGFSSPTQQTLPLVAWCVTVWDEDQAQGATGVARAGQSRRGARRNSAATEAYSVPTSRGDASAQRGRAGFPVALIEGSSHDRMRGRYAHD